MLKLTKFLAGIVAAGSSVAYADDLPKIGKSSIKQVQAVPETPTQLPPTTKAPAPVVPMPVEPATVPPSTMAVVDSATADIADTNRFWGGAEYGIWRVQRSPVATPILLATQPGAFWPVPFPGATVVPPKVLFGNDNVGFPNSSGLTATFGTWLSSERVIGLEASLLTVQKQNVNRDFQAQSPGDLVYVLINRPNGTSAPVAIGGGSGFNSPGTSGNVNIQMDYQFWGYDAKLVFAIDRNEGSSLELVTGYRYLSLEEGLLLTTNAVGVAFAPGTTTNTQDSFKTSNHFYGGQLGLRKKSQWGGFTFDAAGLLSMGVSQQTIDISGQRTSNVPGAIRQGAFGILAHPTNSGIVRQDQFSVVPEVNLKLSYNITQSVAISLGYQGIYWTNVIRPGNLIDPITNTTNLNAGIRLADLTPATTGNPIPQKVSTDFWAQGILFGVNVKY